MSLKQKTVRGALWTLTGNTSSQLLHFAIGIVLARALSPRDYGLVGMLSIFMAIATSMVESGFGQALIQKKNPSDIDYSSVFYLNLGIALIIGSILYFSAPVIAVFFHEPILKQIVIVSSFGLIIQSLTVVQNAILNKELRFKELSIIRFLSYLISGLVAIPLALSGLGVWTLVILALLQSVVNSIFIWIISSWKPKLLLSFKAIRILFNFGSKLLIVGLLDNFFLHVYKLIIGKFFNAAELGFYSRAQGYRDVVSRNAFNVLNSVIFPTFSLLQEKMDTLKSNYVKICELSTFLVTPLLAFMAFSAEYFIRFLITEKWLNTVPYLQILAIAGIFYPVVAIQQNSLKAIGKTSAYLKMTIVHKTAITISIFVTIRWGVLGLVYAQVFSMFLLFIIGIYYIRKYLKINLKVQFICVFKYILISFAVFYSLFFLSKMILHKDILIILFQGIVGAITYYLFNLKFHTAGYIEFKLIFSEQVLPKLKTIYK